MIKIEQDSGGASTESNESMSDYEDGDGVLLDVVADSPAGLTPCTPQQAPAEGQLQNTTPPFLETNFISLLSDYQGMAASRPV